MYVKVIR